MVRLAILIPTRNRAELAEAAIRSALQSPSDEVRIVVSDNSTIEAESARLAAFCKSIGVDRIRPPEPLSMTKHWDWAMEEVLAEAATTHAVILSDRMIFKPGGVETVLRVTRDFPDDVIIYGDDKIIDDERPVGLVQLRWSGVVAAVASRRVLEMSSRMQLHPVPRVMNSVVPRAVFERVRERFGTIFGSTSPDFCFGYRCLFIVERILYYDRSPVLHYALPASNGFSFARGERSPAMDDYLATIGEPPTGYAPIPEIVTPNNGVVHEYCRVRAETGSDKFPPVDPDRYRQLLATDIARMRNEEVRRKSMEMLMAAGDYQRKTSLLRWLQRVLSLPAAPATRPFWRLVARTLRLNPPGDAPIAFATTEEAMAHLKAKPRRRHVTSLHLRVLFGSYREVGRY